MDERVGDFDNAAYAYSVIGGGIGNTANTAVAAASGAVTLTSGSATVSGFPAGIEVGMLVIGTGIPAGTYILALASPNFTISQNATVSGSQTLTFYRGYSCIVGGVNNSIGGTRQFIGGGLSNSTGSGLYHTIVAGSNNIASGGAWNSVVGGDGNWATGAYDFVGGGYQNRVQGTDNGNGRFIGGGFSNSIPIGQTNYSVIVGGSSNTIGIGINTFIGGGLSNTVSAAWATLGGGRQNTMSAGSPTYSFLGGGYLNAVGAAQATLVGGQQNTISTVYSFLGGGLSNSGTLGAYQVVVS